MILPLIDAPFDILKALGLINGFSIYGDDYPTPDGTAIRDYIHVLDLIDAHVRALRYLLKGGVTDIFNLGSGRGFSVKEIVNEMREVFSRRSFKPGIVPRREGDPAILVASSEKAAKILGWRPSRSLQNIIGDTATWHRSPLYQDAIRSKLGLEN
jgi:UDP-glucose 4-epimerase